MGALENAASRPKTWFHIERDYGHTAPVCPTLILGLVITMLRRFLRALHTEDRGQDLAEYCLLTALVVLVAAGIFIHASGGMQAVWTGANVSLTAGSSAVSATPAAAGTPASTTASTPSH